MELPPEKKSISTSAVASWPRQFFTWLPSGWSGSGSLLFGWRRPDRKRCRNLSPDNPAQPGFWWFSVLCCCWVVTCLGAASLVWIKDGFSDGAKLSGRKKPGSMQSSVRKYTLDGGPPWSHLLQFKFNKEKLPFYKSFSCTFKGVWRLTLFGNISSQNAEGTFFRENPQPFSN